MLKVFPENAFGGTASAKCGEIFCQSLTEFTIFCSFCEIKIFEFDDFLTHFKNVHFENNLLKLEKDECSPFVNVKDEIDCENSSTGSVDVDVSPSEANFMKWQVAEVDKNIKCDNSQSEQFTRVVKIKRPYITEQPCGYCKKSFKYRAQLRKHIKDNHNISLRPLSTFKCDECDELFRFQRHLDDHSVKDHTGIKCTGCDKKFQSRESVRRHAVTHLEVKNFLCDFENCTKRFLSKRHLTNHKRTHTGPKNFICDICGYSCRVRETLRVHYRVHTGEKPYECQTCRKRFASSSMLSEHKASHVTDRPHVCDVCGAKFSRPKSLYHHKHLHLEGKKFKCKICGNAYAQAAGLAGHMRKHKEGFY